MDTRHYYITLFALLVCSSLYAQGETNYWYFGNKAGVNFNTIPPTPLVDGQLNTTEGCSTISDANGNLQFYTDGRTVWNRDHQIMSNGDYDAGTGLLGDPSSTSSGLIVPKPRDSNLYYIFTVDEPHHNNAAAYPNAGPLNLDGSPTLDNLYPDTQRGIPETDDGYNNGFNYSVVDMRLNNGLGDVVVSEKNISLLTYDPANSEELKYKCSEKITAVRATDCESYWVITHFVNRFYAYKIDTAGINTTPVVSVIGPTAPLASYRRAGLGYLIASPDGKKLAIAHHTFDFDGTFTKPDGDGGLYLHDFNPETGKVSTTTALTTTDNPYGVAFSQEASKLYATVRKGVSGDRSSDVFQWDLNALNIPGSKIQIAAATDYIGALQLASNSKIYATVSGQNYLAVINAPEEKGSASNYSTAIDEGALFLETQTGMLGLPPFIQSFFEKKIGLIEPEDTALSSIALCEGDTYRLRSEEFPKATYTWYLDDQQLPNTDYFLDVTRAGNYRVVVELNDGSCELRGIATVTILPLPDSRDATLEQCTVPGLTSTFNLTKSIPSITKTNSELTAVFFKSRPDAIANSNPIADVNYQNTTNNEVVFVRVENSKTQCYRVQELTLTLNTNAINTYSLETCDSEGNDGLESFDLTIIEAFLTSNNVTQTKISYYKTAEDALLEQHTLTNPTNISSTTPNTDSYYVRGEDQNNNCISISEIKVVVHPQPVLESDRIIDYCIDSEEPLILNAGALALDRSFYEFLWSPSGETTYEISTPDIVNHTVIVSLVATGCSNQRTFRIKPSQKAIITRISIEGYSRNTSTTIFVNGIGDYEYATDHPDGPYQDNNGFYNLDIGLHEAYIRDKNNCGISGPYEFPVLGFPEFFTPNNDGFHDYWQVEGLLEIDQLEPKIHIFDRYGKLLKTIQGNGQGWDGTFNGKAMLPDDYWVKVQLANGIVLSSHFSLIR